jgi:hypothetical protein
MLRLRHPISLLLICILIIFGVLRSFSTPSPRGADSPDVEFSAIRADALLRDLLQDGVPHVSGSAENRVIRDRLVGHLEAFGYATEVQELFHCNTAVGVCSPVENVIAFKPGTSDKHAILLTAHYDGSWTGPGAADDGAGVSAILEIARMAADYPPFQNEVIFLFSDSEENGLIGADAFANLHPSFKKVGAVINLEARGVTGASAMFETGEGNRRIIRTLSQSVDRPVANSLTYEVYKRMPNDTDYSVYRAKGVLGLNFAFSQGVAVYHSAIDDPDHLDMGSLQHHGDNAWGMLNALGDRRNLPGVQSKEDAGYIDVFAFRLIHYPASIALGLALVLGVIALIAIFLAFRKDFRLWAIRWGLLAIPFVIASIVLGGFLLSFPLGHWADLHPIEHPYPWPGRFALFLIVVLSLYLTLKLFKSRVSPCAMMVLSWGLIFVLAMVLANKLPTASHLMLIPLAMFCLGSIIDLFRKKSRAPLLMASVLGFAGAAFISFYHFFMLDVVVNFDNSHIKILPLIVMAVTSLPMLLAWASDRELSWQPVRWLLVIILAVGFIHLWVPGFTAERPRGMSLIYSETSDSGTGNLVLESIYRNPDMEYASGHGFIMTEVDSGWPERVERPAREVPLENLPPLDMTMQSFQRGDESWRRRFVMEVPGGVPMVQLLVEKEHLLEKAWINGQLALDTSIESKYRGSVDRLRVIHPGPGPLEIELQTGRADAVQFAAVTWHPMSAVLMAPFLGNWPDDAQPFVYGPRARKIQRFELNAGAEVE